MGYNDARRFPDFSYISKTGKFNSNIDCVIITHLYVPLTSHLSPLPLTSFPPLPSPYSLISPTLTFLIVLSSHLDHCGALPYFTEMCGYDGPIFMTVCPSSLPFSPVPFLRPPHLLILSLSFSTQQKPFVLYC